MPGMTATILPFPTRVARWERKPAPHPDKNIGAEMIVIGSIIRDWQNYFRAAPIIASRHFADLSHAELYRRIEVRIDAEFSVSVGELEADFFDHPVLTSICLHRLLSCAVAPVDVPAFAQSIQDSYNKRVRPAYERE
jgi:replicative DNA helicase